VNLDDVWPTIADAAYDTFTQPHLMLVSLAAMVIGAFIGWAVGQRR